MVDRSVRSWRIGTGSFSSRACWTGVSGRCSGKRGAESLPDMPAPKSKTVTDTSPRSASTTADKSPRLSGSTTAACLPLPPDAACSWDRMANPNIRNLMPRTSRASAVSTESRSFSASLRQEKRNRSGRTAHRDAAAWSQRNIRTAITTATCCRPCRGKYFSPWTARTRWRKCAAGCGISGAMCRRISRGDGITG